MIMSRLLRLLELGIILLHVANSSAKVLQKLLSILAGLTASATVFCKVAKLRYILWWWQETHIQRHHRRNSGIFGSSRWHRKSRPLLAMEGFIYVYDLPARFNKDSLQLGLAWHSDQYDYDIMIHDYLMTSPLRTSNPAEAKLFFMPLYLSREMNWFWQRTDREVRIYSKNSSSYPKLVHGLPRCRFFILVLIQGL
jgi:Exostosin family